MYLIPAIVRDMRIVSCDINMLALYDYAECGHMALDGLTVEAVWCAGRKTPNQVEVLDLVVTIPINGESETYTASIVAVEPDMYRICSEQWREIPIVTVNGDDLHHHTMQFVNDLVEAARAA